MRRRAAQSTCVCLALSLAGCVPWTVRPIESAEEKQNQARGRFNAASYVDSIWSSKLVPAVLNSAVDLRTLLAALEADAGGAARKYGQREGEGPFHFMVKGRGRVLAIDTRSRTGLASVDLAPGDGKPDAFLQVGPVIRGTSLRDAVGFIRFGQFVNQLQFADVANELNARVMNSVLARLKLPALRGKVVSFCGTFTLTPGSPPDIVPVKLEVEERGE